jgi:hypothetical protein
VKRALVLLLPAFTLLAACDEPPKTDAPTTAASTSKDTKKASVAVLIDNDLAVPADFEEQAEKDITAANYKAELDKLEAEPAQ